MGTAERRSKLKTFLFKNLNVLIVICTVSLFCQITIIGSPGWIKFNLTFFKDVHVSSAKESVPNTTSDLNIDVSVGLWFFTFCFKHNYRNITAGSCFSQSYLDLDSDVQIKVFKFLHLKHLHDFCTNIFNGVLEYQIETTMSIGFCLLGVAFFLLFYRSKGTPNGFGVISCGSLTISAILLWVVVGKIATIIVQMKLKDDLRFEQSRATNTVRVPWCLLVAGLSASLLTFATMTFLAFLAKDPTSNKNPRNEMQRPIIDDEQSECSRNHVPLVRIR